MSLESNIKVNCRFELDKLSSLINERVSGQMITEKLKLESLDLHGDHEWLNALIRVSGRHNGAITARFKLMTSKDISDFIVEDLEIRISEGGGLLAKGANFVLRRLLGDRIESKVQEKIHDVIQQLIREMTSRYSVVKLGEGLELSSLIDDYNFDKITWDSKQLNIVLATNAVINLELK